MHMICMLANNLKLLGAGTAHYVLVIIYGF